MYECTACPGAVPFKRVGSGDMYVTYVYILHIIITLHYVVM